MLGVIVAFTQIRTPYREAVRRGIPLTPSRASLHKRILVHA